MQVCGMQVCGLLQEFDGIIDQIADMTKFSRIRVGKYTNMITVEKILAAVEFNGLHDILDSFAFKFRFRFRFFLDHNHMINIAVAVRQDGRRNTLNNLLIRL